jgi:hypothetical protein
MATAVVPGASLSIHRNLWRRSNRARALAEELEARYDVACLD